MNDFEIGGKKINKWWLIGGAGGAVLVFYLYKKNQSSSSSSGSNAIDPLTGMPYSQDSQIDPLTGMSYLSEAQQYGSVQAAENAVASGSAYGSGYTSGGGFAGGSSGTAGFGSLSGSTTQQASGSFDTNAQWAQTVTTGLTQLGYSSTDVSAALGLYLSGLPLGTAPDGVSYLTIVQAAVAEFGPPPVGTFQIIGSNTNSTPPPGQGSPPPDGGGGTPPPSGGGTPPPPSGGGGTPPPVSGRLPVPTGIHVRWASNGSGSVGWNAVPGANAYVFQLKAGGDNGRTVSGPFFVSQPVANFGPGIPKGALTAFVWPSDPSDRGGPGSNQPHAALHFTMH